MGKAINATGQIIDLPNVSDADRSAAASRMCARRLPGYISDAADRLRDGGITVSGIPVGTDTRAIALLTGAHDYMAANPAASVQWVMSSTQAVTLNKAQVDAMWAAVTGFIQATYAAEANANASAKSFAEADAIFAAVQRVF